jgi:hypothetical protein
MHCLWQHAHVHAVSHLRLGTLADLRNAKKGGLDPDPDRESVALLVLV